jgi:predicted ester cyclase
MPQQNEAIVRRLIDEAWNRGNLSVVDDCIASDCIAAGPLDNVRGPQGMKNLITKYRSAFPDCRLEVLDMLSSGDLVVTRFRYSGTHLGQFDELKPTGRLASGEGITLDRIKDGRVIESRSQWDALGLMQQLGVVTLPGRAKAAGA